MQYRQGDLFFEKIEQFPKRISLRPVITDDLILAHGEATGHAHRMESDSVLSHAGRTTGRQYLEVKDQAKVFHEEHDPLSLPAGKYLVRRQREYTPEKIRIVVD